MQTNILEENFHRQNIRSVNNMRILPETESIHAVWFYITNVFFFVIFCVSYFLNQNILSKKLERAYILFVKVSSFSFLSDQKRIRVDIYQGADYSFPLHFYWFSIILLLNLFRFIGFLLAFDFNITFKILLLLVFY